jgi:hypothetical protein
MRQTDGAVVVHMTPEQEKQLRVVLAIEGFTPEEVEKWLIQFRTDPEYTKGFLQRWRYRLGTKQ